MPSVRRSPVPLSLWGKGHIPRAVRHLETADPALARWMARVGPCRLAERKMHSPFEALCQAVLHQQVNGRAAAAIQDKVHLHFGTTRFPPAARLRQSSVEELRSCGLSRAKARSVLDLAERAETGQLPTRRQLARMDDEAVVATLTEARGIGRWTAEMLLMFRLGRPDVLPATDYGVQQGFQRVFRTRDLPAPKQILARGERWRPFRTVASWYLWRALEVE